jgi:pyrimidine-nucleoside phosphorylase
MRAVDIIIKKRDGGELNREEIQFFVKGFAEDTIPDYQAASFAMAVFFNGMTPRETADLTYAMTETGDLIDLHGVVDIAVDKHSTGGVGDKTTLVVAPVVSACGLPVGKMSGRGLGFVGGTWDKMESIPGYRLDLTTEEFLNQLKDIGLVLTGQTADLAPADGKLYALRDVTGTVKSIPLIASSVMSKKLAAGAQAIVLDVKCGLGGLVETIGEARKLATLLVSIAHQADRKAIALLSDMNQPLGIAVGNALELREAIDILHGRGPGDFREHCIVVASQLLVLGGIVKDSDEARSVIQKALESGKAWQRFRDLVIAQGGDVTYIDHPEKLPLADYSEDIDAKSVGFIKKIDARVVGETVVFLGGGRAKKGDPIDHGVGILVHKNVGDRVENGETIFTVYANQEEKLVQARTHLLGAVELSDSVVDPLPLFYGMVQ